MVYQRDFKRFKAKLSDVDAVADDSREIEGVKIAALFRETEKKYPGSIVQFIFVQFSLVI